MSEYVGLKILLHRDEKFTEEELDSILLDTCIFLDDKFKTMSTGSLVTLSEGEL